MKLANLKSWLIVVLSYIRLNPVRRFSIQFGNGEHVICTAKRMRRDNLDNLIEQYELQEIIYHKYDKQAVDFTVDYLKAHNQLHRLKVLASVGHIYIPSSAHKR